MPGSDRRISLPGVLPRLPLTALLAVLLAALASAQAPVPQVTLPDLNSLPRPPARVPIFFPPGPPPPGGEIDPVTPLLEPNWDPPAGLEPYVGEVFYPIVGSRLAERDLSRRQRARLDAYVGRRTDLVAALQAWVDRQAPLPSGHDEAVRQLEAEAESLRVELINDSYAWGVYRGWRVGPPQTEKDESVVRIREFQVLRATVFYYTHGLSLEQRWLLWDHVLRRGASGPGQALDVPAVRPGSLLRFLPAGAQLRLPRTLPDGLRADLEAFVAAKDALQRDLADTIVRLDSASRREYGDGYKALVERQRLPVLELERQAEAIRAALAALPPEEPVVLPEPLASQARAYQADREALQAGLAAPLREVRTRVLRYRPGSETLMWISNFKSGAMVPVTSIGPFTSLQAMVVETPPQRGRAEQAWKQLSKARETYEQETAARREEVAVAGEKLFIDVLAYFSPETPADQPIPATLANKLLAVLVLNEAAGRMDRYASYVAATVRPGLTPAQRRLLFGQALRDLALPLPAGIRRPINDMSAP